MTSTTTGAAQRDTDWSRTPRHVGATGAAVRLTRRGRAALLLLLVALLSASFLFGRAASQAATDAPVRPQLAQTTVQPGETLWSVARRVAPQRDAREVVAQLRAINALPTAGLRAGQQLLLPVPA